MLWETRGNRRNTFCLHTHMFIIPNFHFSERVWAGSCSHHKRGIFLPDFPAFQAKRGGERTSASAPARALHAAASGHRGAEEEMPGSRALPLVHSRRRSQAEKSAPDQVCGDRGSGPGMGRGCGGGSTRNRSSSQCPRLVSPISPAAPGASRGERGSPSGASAGCDSEPAPRLSPAGCTGPRTRSAQEMPKPFPQERRGGTGDLRPAGPWVRSSRRGTGFGTC